MPNRSQRIAWHAFREAMIRHEAAMDGTVPVVLIAMPIAHDDGEGNVSIDLNGGPTQFFAPGGPSLEERAQIFDRAAAECRALDPSPRPAAHDEADSPVVAGIREKLRTGLFSSSAPAEHAIRVLLDLADARELQVGMVSRVFMVAPDASGRLFYEAIPDGEGAKTWDDLDDDTRQSSMMMADCFLNALAARLSAASLTAARAELARRRTRKTS